MSASESDQTIFISRPEGLKRMLSLEEAAADIWNPEEMEAMWLHQLGAEVQTDLTGVEGAGIAKSQLQEFAGKSFRQLLQHEQPPIELLRLTKEFAKQTLKDCQEKHLKQLASALYYASYAAGLVRCGTRIGSTKNPDLESGFQWALELPWLDNRTKALLREGLKAISANCG
jgi:hypothetical protein